MSLHPLPDKSSGFDPVALKAAIVFGFFVLGVGFWGLEMIRLRRRTDFNRRATTQPRQNAAEPAGDADRSTSTFKVVDSR